MRALALTLFSMASSSFVRNFPTASITALRSYSSNVLLVATTVDEASNNIAQALKASCCNWKTWSSSKDSSILSVSALNYKVCTSVADETSVVWLWIQDKPLLHMNNVDKLFNEEFLTSESEADRDSRGVSFDEVLFLSKHSAASGKASLTVHPIGIPWLTNSAECGGFPGRCSPPNKRIAGMQDQFEVTLEATHHGPHVDLPACFVEIGSTELEWGIPEAGSIWADCLLRHLGVSSDEDRESGAALNTELTTDLPAHDDMLTEETGGVVLMSIGGGHYVPKVNDVARFGAGMYTGHSLATYTLEKHLNGSEKNPVPGGWQRIISEALDSTIIAHPIAKLVVLLDKKAFIAEHKHNIIALLEERGVTWTHKTADVRVIWEQAMLSGATK